MQELKVYKKNRSQFGSEYLYSFSKEFESKESLQNWVLNYLNICEVYEDNIIAEIDYRNYAIYENQLFDVNDAYFI